MTPVQIDGSMGEGGGQVLRSALTLSLLSGRSLEIRNVRLGRSRPGLRPQHLAAVQAAAAISGARVAGDRVGSRTLAFRPGPVTAGQYHFDIGTAGATALVLQTICLPLALAEGPSQVSVSGGTHVPWSPCFDYLDLHWRHFLARMGISMDLELAMAGFYPEGGGLVRLRLPGGARLRPVTLVERGSLQALRGLSAVANLDWSIAERQRRRALRRLQQRGLSADIEERSLPAASRGTLLLLLARFEHSQACCFALGARGKPAERVADEAVDSLFEILDRPGSVDPWLADQLLLPLAWAAGPAALTTTRISGHLLTNAQVIRQFVDRSIEVRGEPGEPGQVTLA